MGVGLNLLVLGLVLAIGRSSRRAWTAWGCWSQSGRSVPSVWLDSVHDCWRLIRVFACLVQGTSQSPQE
ncbi:hypothetical protein M758_1G041100 [Ceratodon purpureus]|uniref:Secreted protein n=1 Tax=Ceratodon purpureus TaxID=3225 RepID=A0A8T0J4A6_CERPU|nr:hypothetical protein KC19_1G043700 [Ceratodon purpureus]KAG0628629.1 hypothetical protein M758_1G041100 [Ceratodon purpureus]